VSQKPLFLISPKGWSADCADFADLAVIDRDYLGCPEEDIRKIKALLTMVGGKVVSEQN
jgi:predicted amidohydrolase YtcJ